MLVLGNLDFRCSHFLQESSVRNGVPCILTSWGPPADLLRGLESTVGSSFQGNLMFTYYLIFHFLPESSARNGFQCILTSWAPPADLMRGSDSTVRNGFQGILML